MKEHIIEALGWIGTICILVAVFMLMNDFITNQSFTFIILNILGSVTLGTNLYFRKAWGGLALQLCFIGIFLYSFVKNFVM